MPVRGAKAKIHEAVMSWPYVGAGPHQFDATEYLLGKKREIGHIHGNHTVDIPFPRKVRDELVAAGKAEPHHFLPDSGAVTLYLREAEDVARAIDLLRLSYDLALKQQPHLVKQQPDDCESE